MWLKSRQVPIQGFMCDVGDCEVRVVERPAACAMCRVMAKEREEVRMQRVRREMLMSMFRRRW